MENEFQFQRTFVEICHTKNNTQRSDSNFIEILPDAKCSCVTLICAADHVHLQVSGTVLYMLCHPHGYYSCVSENDDTGPLWMRQMKQRKQDSAKALVRVTGEVMALGRDGS